MTKRTCSIPDCGRPYRSKGYCQSHYTRFRAYGDPLARGTRLNVAAGQTCSVDGCDAEVRCMNLCRTHYDRMRLTDRFDLRTDAERFWSRTVTGAAPINPFRSVPGPCVLWTAAANPRGYGNFYLAGAYVNAHRVSYEWAHGPIPDGLQVDHVCRVTACVNPDHLEAVTPLVNMRRSMPFRRSNIGLLAEHVRQENDDTIGESA